MINYNEQRIDIVKDQSTEKRIIVPLMNIFFNYKTSDVGKKNYISKIKKV